MPFLSLLLPSLHLQSDPGAPQCTQPGIHHEHIKWKHSRGCFVWFFFSETALLVPYPWMTASQGLSEAAGGLQDPGSRRAELPLSLTLVVCLESSSPMSHGHHLKIQ